MNKQELEKCRDNPYYFATTYLTIKNDEDKVVPFSTEYNESEFNTIINNARSYRELFRLWGRKHR